MTDNHIARVTRSKARWIDSGCRLMSVWAPVITLAQRHSDTDRQAIAMGYRNYYSSRSAASAQLRRYMNRMPISMGLDAAINHYARFIETGSWNPPLSYSDTGGFSLRFKASTRVTA